MSAQSWQTVLLGDHCLKIGSGFTPRGGESVYTQEGVCFIRSQNVYNGRFEDDGLVCLSDDDAARLNGVTVKEHDILLNITGDSVARACMAPPHVLPARVNQHVAIIRPIPESIDPRFLGYYLITPHMQSTMLSLSGSGGTRKALTKEMIEDFHVPAPPVHIQRRIAAILGGYDDLIQNNRRRISLLEEAARQLYREWFVRLHFPGREHTGVVDGVPIAWERATIADLVARGAVKLQTGPFGTELKASDYVEQGTPVINVRNIGVGELRAEKLEYVPDDVVDRLSQHVLRSGDIVFGRKGAVDRHLLVTRLAEGYLQGSDCIRLRLLARDLSSPMLSFAFREDAHQQWMITQCSNKATMASLNQEVLGRIEVLIPPHAIVEAFDETASFILSQIDNLQLQNAKLRAARDLLLPRLMSGELAA